MSQWYLYGDKTTWVSRYVNFSVNLSMWLFLKQIFFKIEGNLRCFFKKRLEFKIVLAKHIVVFIWIIIHYFFIWSVLIISFRQFDSGWHFRIGRRGYIFQDFQRENNFFEFEIEILMPLVKEVLLVLGTKKLNYKWGFATRKSKD